MNRDYDIITQYTESDVTELVRIMEECLREYLQIRKNLP